jgi:Fe-S-cluster containining protein
MSRGQRKTLLKEYVKAYERDGFNPRRIFTVFGFVRDVIDVLGNTRNPKRLSDAGALTFAVYEAAAKIHSKPAEAACKKGCGFCCHTVVTATLPEIFALAKSLDEQWNDEGASFKADFQKAEALTRGLPLAERWPRHIPCPFLFEGSCGIYAQRPLSCRAYVSKSLAACMDLYNGVRNNVPQSEIDQAIRMLLFGGLKAGLVYSGLDSVTYEIGHALHIALGQDAETRWLAGEPLFAEVFRDTRPNKDAAEFELLVQVLLAASFGKEVPPNPWFRWPA